MKAKKTYKKGGKFPDLTGDGKVTKADILKGRGVKAKGGKVVAQGADKDDVKAERKMKKNQKKFFKAVKKPIKKAK